MRAGGVLAHPPCGLLGPLDLRDQPAHRRVQPGEVDAGCLANQAAATIAPDEILRPQALAVGERGVDATLVLRGTRHFTFSIDSHRQLTDPLGQDALDVVLRQREQVVVPRGEIADIERDQCETRGPMHLSLRQEPFGDSTLIEDLDGARVQTAGARAGKLLVGAPLDNGNVDARQRQLARQHQSCRTASDNQHCMVGRAHFMNSISAGSGNGRRCCATTRGLRQACRRAIF